MYAALSWFTNLYPLWIVVSSLVGFLHPPALQWFSGSWVTWALTLVMLGMGFTLSPKDFKGLLKMPGAVAVGFTAQYTIMPLCGWLLGVLLHLEPGFAVGMILLASCPGGTASNLITYLARANVALSVIMTLCSTMLAFIMTPLWCRTLAGQIVPVDALGLCLSTLQVVVLPVLIGVLCNWLFPKTVARIATAGPVVSVIAIIFIAGGIVAQSAEAVAENFGKLAFATTVLHLLGFGVGYVISRMFRYNPQIAQTVSIEVGMQNGGMAAMLAKKHFMHEPMSAVPAVFSSVIQTLIGSLLAGYWRVKRNAPSSNNEARQSIIPTTETAISKRGISDNA